MWSPEKARVLRTRKEVQAVITCFERRCEKETSLWAAGLRVMEGGGAGRAGWLMGDVQKKKPNKLICPIWVRVGEVAPQCEWGRETKSNEYVEAEVKDEEGRMSCVCRVSLGGEIVHWDVDTVAISLSSRFTWGLICSRRKNKTTWAPRGAVAELHSLHQTCGLFHWFHFKCCILYIRLSKSNCLWSAAESQSIYGENFQTTTIFPLAKWAKCARFSRG